MMPNHFKEQSTRNRRVDSTNVPTFGMEKMAKKRPSVNLISNKNSQFQTINRYRAHEFPSPQSPRSNSFIFDQEFKDQKISKNPEKIINLPASSPKYKLENTSSYKNNDCENENDISFLPVMKTAQNNKNIYNSPPALYESKSATQSQWKGTFQKPKQEPSVMRRSEDKRTRKFSLSPVSNSRNENLQEIKIEKNEDFQIGINRYSPRSNSYVPTRRDSSYRDSQQRRRKSSGKKKSEKKESKISKLFEDNKFLSDQIIHLKDVISSLEGKVIELERNAQTYKEKFEIGEIEKQFFMKKFEDLEKNEEIYQNFCQEIDKKVSSALSSQSYNSPCINEQQISWMCLHDIKVPLNF